MSRFRREHLRPEWLASETGMARSLYRLFAEKGLVVAHISRIVGSICAPARCKAPMMTKAGGDRLQLGLQRS